MSVRNYLITEIVKLVPLPQTLLPAQLSFFSKHQHLMCPTDRRMNYLGGN